MNDTWEFLSSDLMLPGDERRLESPIERAMFRCVHYVMLGFVAAPLAIESQVRIGNYRADLVLCDPDGSRLLVVECDGHDFHDRTKEQAARDKSRDREFLLSHGLPVIRFTGAEIHARPFGCAAEAIACAMARKAKRP